MRVEVLDDPEAAARRGAQVIAAAAEQALRRAGAFSLALSGGRGPWRMFELLCEHKIDWERVRVLQVDERVAPDGDRDRNLAHLLESLPAAARDRVEAMPVTAGDLEAAAATYAARLPGAIDLVHLGLGPDGHTASLVPDDPVLEVLDRPVALTGEYQGRRRMTLTYPTLGAAAQLLWLVTGADKAAAVAKLRARDPSVPAGRVGNPNSVLVADRSACPGSAGQGADRWPTSGRRR